MRGFIDGKPVLAKVTWAAAEVALLNGEAEQYGLRAETANPAGGIVRWFVPWAQISYLKQDIPDQVFPQPAVVATGAVTPPPGD
jgi:hypothetical protein